MGFMDFLKKKNDAGIGSEGLNLESNGMDATSGMNFNSQQPSPGMDYQPEHNMNSSMGISSMNNSSYGQMQQTSQGSDISKDLQMISLKVRNYPY